MAKGAVLVLSLLYKLKTNSSFLKVLKAFLFPIFKPITFKGTIAESHVGLFTNVSGCNKSFKVDPDPSVKVYSTDVTPPVSILKYVISPLKKAVAFPL